MPFTDKFSAKMRIIFQISGFIRSVNEIWNFTQRRLVVGYRHLGTTNLSRLGMLDP
jgi:hypothetical protein